MTRMPLLKFGGGATKDAPEAGVADVADVAGKEAAPDDLATAAVCVGKGRRSKKTLS